MQAIFGKKMRKKNPRSNVHGERLHAVMIEKFYNFGFFSESGKLVAPVIGDWVRSKCSDYQAYRNRKTGKLIRTGGDKIIHHPLDALFDCPTDFLMSTEKLPHPKRWQDTTHVICRYMHLDALRCEGVPHRQITFWIGRDLIEESKLTGKPLAAWLLKRLSDRLRRLLGDTEFGLWFHLEHKPDDPDKIHAHGLIYIMDESWFKYRSAKYRDLRDNIRSATGFVPDIDPESISMEKWLFTPNKPLNHGNQDYSTKSDRLKSFHLSYAGEPTLEIGELIEATSHSLRRRSQAFYERMRPLVSAFITGEVLDWDDDQWEAIGVTYEKEYDFSVPE